MLRSKLSAAVLAGGMALVSAGLGAVPAAGATPARTVFVHRVAGATRYQTSVLVAEATYPDGVPSGNAVLATGANYPDALAGSYLAGQLGDPIVLVPPTASDPNFSSVAAALGQLKVHRVYILGGTSAVGPDVQSALSHYFAVERLAGATRYDTMEMADTRPAQSPGVGVSGARTAIVASGQEFADALAAGPLAWDRHFPVITTDGSQASLAIQALDVIHALDITHFLVMGGPAAINPDQVIELGKLGTIDRQFAGIDRTQTAQLLDAYTVAHYGFATNSVILADGANFPDALAAGPWGGDPRSIYLTETDDQIGPYTTAGLQAVSADLTALDLLGGVDDNAADQAAAAVGASAVPSNQSYAVTPASARSVTAVTSKFGATGLGSKVVDIALFRCSEVDPDSGQYEFAGTEPGSTSSTAILGSVPHESITLVDGKKTSGQQVDSVTPVDGAVAFTVTSNGGPGDCLIPVVFAHTAQNRLPLGANYEPTVAFGAGGATTFTDTSLEPTVTTRAATAVGPNAATFQGSIDPHGHATVYYWRFGPATAGLVQSTISQKTGDGDSTVKVSVAQGGLTPDTTYDIELVATNAYGTVDGTVSSFTTSPNPAPTVTSVSPDSGVAAGGTAVVVKGTNLTGATAVYFGSGAASTVKVSSATELTADTPSGTAGSTVVVTVTTALGTSTSVGTPGANEYQYAPAG